MKTTQTGFNAFPLAEKLQLAIEKMGFEVPTPIQFQAIPVALKGQDVLGCAGTGTGKTAAFCIPLVNHLLTDSRQSAIVLAPTRELAAQTAKVLDALTRSSARGNLRVALLIGGESMVKQKHMLRGNPRIIVGTPGRINDHLDARRFQARFFNTLVLDEADRMLDMGFKPQIMRIVSQLPKKRQTHLFSATVPDQIRKLAASYQRNPTFIDLREKEPAGGGPDAVIVQHVVPLQSNEKKERLLDELNARDGTAIVFVGTKRGTDRIAHFLNSYGHSVGLLHGGRSQGQRNRAIKDFRAGKSRILVATDVAARGIDVPHIAHIINYDLPQTAEDYIHRIGRTGRAGASGCATCFVVPEDISMWRRIVRLGVGAPALQSLKFAEGMPTSRPPRQRGGGRPGRKKNRRAKPGGRAGAKRRADEPRGRKKKRKKFVKKRRVGAR